MSTDLDPEDVVAPTSEDAPPARRRHWRRWAALTLVAAMLAIGAVGFWRAHELRSSDAVQNHALVDAAATAEVQSQVSQALVKVFSYNYADPSPTLQAATSSLSGQAKTQYDTLFTTLQAKAPDQKLVLSAQAQTAAVAALSERSATLLVFLDQSSQRASDAEASVSAAQIAVEATKVGDTWMITGLQPL